MAQLMPLAVSLAVSYCCLTQPAPACLPRQNWQLLVMRFGCQFCTTATLSVQLPYSIQHGCQLDESSAVIAVLIAINSSIHDQITFML